jgi:hypothetical protein
MVFTDLAGVIYHLRLVPWAVEGFDPKKDREALQNIADGIATVRPPLSSALDPARPATATAAESHRPA